MTTPDVPDPREVDVLVEQIRPILAGHNPVIQGGVLADLLAMWLAGHVGSDEKRVAEFREEILRLHIETVRALVPVNEDIMLARIAAAGRG